VPPGENVLAVALAAGIAIPYSCRAGRCASCKSRLVSGKIEYPAEFNGAPPGITAVEIARGDVLLCQARPRSDLSVEVRRAPVRAPNAASCELIALDVLPMGALLLKLRFQDPAAAASLPARPGQYVDVRNHAGDVERLPVVGVDADILLVESPDDGSALHQWLSRHAVTGAQLRVSGPFDRPR
jgi:CDP-4-dehydro-6-deoxyglucose reductase